MPNQNPEQIARDNIDQMLTASGWIVQSKKDTNLNAGLGVAIREYQTDVGPADYAGSFHIEIEDFELDPFNKAGGLGKMWQLFGEKTEEILEELNEVLAA
jgi:hypothetical protein